MRVLLITGSFPPDKCGVGDYTWRLAEQLSKQAGVVVAVATSSNIDIPTGGMQYEVFRPVKQWSLREWPLMWKLFGVWKPDIVHVQYPTQGYERGLLPPLLPWLAYLHGVKVVQTWHEVYRRVGIRGLVRFLPKALVRGGLVVVRPKFRETTHWPWRWVFHNKILRFVENASPMPPAILNADERSAIRAKFGAEGKRLIGFFGFLYPPKRVELLFSLCNPATDRVVIVGAMSDDDPYHRSILNLSESDAWKGKTSITGFLPGEEASRIIAALDALVLPFKGGGGEWNTSIHSAVAQGTFVLTTSMEREGYDERSNIFFARPDDLDSMRQALDRYAGTRGRVDVGAFSEKWSAIARSHVALYSALLNVAAPA